MDSVKTRYEELIRKSELATITASKSETTWAYEHWSDVADDLMQMARSLPLDKASGVY